ncbi:MAG: DUF4159 domain-containing protein [Planctomycetes bacterium]|nr:DUF4159 domain-containing protein [Planctomycetota bacterium]
MEAANNRALQISRRAAQLICAYAVIWLLCLANWMWIQFEASVVSWLQAIVFVASLPISISWIRWATRPSQRQTQLVCFVLTVAYVLLWHLGVFSFDAVEWDVPRTHLARVGTAGLFFVGLAWSIWAVERASQVHESRRRSGQSELPIVRATPATSRAGDVQSDQRINNPFDPSAWYYGRRNAKLNQSVTALSGYSVAFLILFLIFTQMGGCQELYEMPAGGGQQQTIAQTLKVQKVIKKKFVVNPFSAISFKVPPIDEVKLQLTEITEHAYTVGYGEGAGAGFAGGTPKGQVRFIRLEYAGGDWDQDFGIGADVNMLIEYGIRTKQKVAKQTESRTVGQLKNFLPEKSPPMVYLTGQRNISISDSEVKVLREYVIDKHGMIFGDNGGSGHFHNQFVGLMRRVLPNVRPSKIPLDDSIHRIPFQIPFLPYVAPHGGKDALGWRVDGRLVCYYHPGDIGDAWTDDHSGVSPEIYEACYQLGTNVIFYAHSEYSKWLASRQQKAK